jgi:hypothetical protein
LKKYNNKDDDMIYIKTNILKIKILDYKIKFFNDFNNDKIKNILFSNMMIDNLIKDFINFNENNLEEEFNDEN